METSLPTAASLEAQDASFWNKLVTGARWAGRTTVEKALLLYYAAKSPNVPAWAKGVIFSALAYFILPLDTVPDFIPGVGYTDDLGTMLAAFGIVAWHITPEIKEQARIALARWFPSQPEA